MNHILLAIVIYVIYSLNMSIATDPVRTVTTKMKLSLWRALKVKAAQNTRSMPAELEAALKEALEITRRKHNEQYCIRTLRRENYF